MKSLMYYHEKLKAKSIPNPFPISHRDTLRQDFPTSSRQQPLKLSTHRSHFHLTSPCCRYPPSVAVLTSPASVIPSPSRRCASPGTA
ncbi:hypothetical protein PIB30_016893 [Stylosanthes scabra]|uniref:Uncharacterized protein n=1 Tax=Stylosanthes scabra TaxID=79078 RepID=A0ABU6V938_9FABA|nr:hypothetical protein [Stylosanthes scabra]